MGRKETLLQALKGKKKKPHKATADKAFSLWRGDVQWVSHALVTMAWQRWAVHIMKAMYKSTEVFLVWQSHQSRVSHVSRAMELEVSVWSNFVPIVWWNHYFSVSATENFLQQHHKKRVVLDLHKCLWDVVYTAHVFRMNLELNPNHLSKNCVVWDPRHYLKLSHVAVTRNNNRKENRCFKVATSLPDSNNDISWGYGLTQFEIWLLNCQAAKGTTQFSPDIWKMDFLNR